MERATALEKHTLYIFFVAFLLLFLTSFEADYSFFFLLAAFLVALFYTLRFKAVELLTAFPAVFILFFISLLIHGKPESGKVVWIRVCGDDCKVVLTENRRSIKVCDNSVEIGDTVDEKGNVVKKGNPLLSFIPRLRYSFYRKVEENLDYPVSAVVGAVTLGVRYEIPYGVKGYVLLSGNYPYLAISGLHVGIVVGFLGLILKVFRVRRPLTKASVAVLPLMPLTGFPPSAVRAYVFMFLIALGLENYRRVDPIYLLGVVLVITTVFQGVSLSSALSFSAVCGILLFLRGSEPVWKRTFAAAVASFFYTLPLVLANFGTVNVLSFLTSAVTGFFFVPFLILSFVSALTQFKVELLNRITDWSGYIFLYLNRELFFLTRFAVFHFEAGKVLTAITLLSMLFLILLGYRRLTLLPPVLMLIFGFLNPIEVVGKKLEVEGWRLNSFSFVSTDGQKYRGCKIYGDYVFPVTREFLFRNKVIDKRAIIDYPLRR